MSKPVLHMSRLNRPWHMEPPEKVHGAVFGMVSALEEDQSARRMDNALLRSLYKAKGVARGVHGDELPNLNAVYMGDGVWTYNLIRTAVDVLGAKVGRSKPKASFVTTGGTWAQQRRAKRLDRYVYGVMHAAGFYRTARRVFRDAAVTDLGVVKGWVEGGKVHLARVDPDEIKVSAADAYNGQPRTLVHTYCVSREQAHQWVDAWHADTSEEERERMHHAVDAAQASSSNAARTLRRTSTFGDVVEVNEAWSLGGGPEGNGRHVLALSSVTLVDEDSCAFFPFAFCRIFEPFHGFYGQGVGELLVAHQRSINIVARRMSSIIRLMATSRYWLPTGSIMKAETVASNESAVVIRGGDKPPVTLVGNSVPPELWRMMDYTIMRGLEQVGLNEGQPAARKPGGITSGQGLRDYEDIQSERHAPIHMAFEDCILDAARLVVALSAKAAEDGERLIAFYPRGQRSEEVEWSKVALDEAEFTLQVHSTSSLPTTPAARKQYVEELWGSGQIDSAEYRRLLDLPDTDAANDLALAARDVVDAALERILDGDDEEGAEDDYTSPEPFDDLAYCMKRGTVVYHRARLEGAPEARLELVRRYIIQAQGLLEQAQAASGGVQDMRAPDAAQPGAAV
jgi:hypothetical protein